jgi:hypothetical protein
MFIFGLRRDYISIKHLLKIELGQGLNGWKEIKSKSLSIKSGMPNCFVKLPKISGVQQSAFEGQIWGQSREIAHSYFTKPWNLIMKMKRPGLACRVSSKGELNEKVL